MSGDKVQIEEPPSNGVIQSPDGEIQYYTKSIKNKNNPYLKQYVLHDEESNTNSNFNSDYSEIECNGEIIIISTNNLNRAINLECKANIVRFLCLIDFFINFFASMTTYYMTTTSIIVASISICGYYSTFIYSRVGLISYLIYQYMQSIGKITVLSIYIAAAISSEFRENLKNNKVLSIVPTPEKIVILTCITLAQIYITGFVQHFYNLMPQPRRVRRMTHS